MYEKKDVRIIRLGQLKSEKFAGMAHTQTPQLKYQNGPLLANVEVFTVFWGSAWQNQPAVASLSQSINQFFAFILTSPLIDQLGEYSVSGHTIGHGQLVGSATLPTEPGPPVWRRRSSWTVLHSIRGSFRLAPDRVQFAAKGKRLRSGFSWRGW